MGASRRAAVTGFVAAAGIYLLAVLNRTSLGVAGLLAEERFHIGPAELSVFIFVQLGVYALMQIPTGILVDRYGPRRLLVTAALILGTAQLLFALIPSYPAALAARTLLGCGDALTYVSVLRFAATRFSRRRYPLLVAITSTSGAVGNVVATLPLADVLHHLGWTTGFAGAAIASLLAAGAGYAALPAGPRHGRRAGEGRLGGLAQDRARATAIGRKVRAAWALPGTRLGFWVLFAAMSVNTSFGLLWGNSYLIKAAGFSPSRAGAVLMYTVIVSALTGPVFGWLIGRHPVARVPMAVGACVTTMAGWLLAVAAFGPHPPAGYVVGLFLAMGLLSQTCLGGFALARDYNPSGTLGTATGAVNVGGFAATVAITVGIGLALAALGGSSAQAFRGAVLVAVAVQAYGTFRVLVWLRRLRAQTLTRQLQHRTVPVPVVRHRWDLPEPAADGRPRPAAERR